MANNIPIRDKWKFEHWDMGFTVPPDYVFQTKLGTEFRWEFGDDKVIIIDTYTRGWHVWSNMGSDTIQTIRPYGRFEWDNPKIQEAVYKIADKLRLRYNNKMNKRKKRKNPDKLISYCDDCDLTQPLVREHCKECGGKLRTVTKRGRDSKNRGRKNRKRLARRSRNKRRRNLRRSRRRNPTKLKYRRKSRRNPEVIDYGLEDDVG